MINFFEIYLFFRQIYGLGGAYFVSHFWKLTSLSDQKKKHFYKFPGFGNQYANKHANATDTDIIKNVGYYPKPWLLPWCTAWKHNCASFFFVPLENHYFVFIIHPSNCSTSKGDCRQKKILGWVAFFGNLEKILFFLAIIAFVSDNWMSSTF